MTHIEFVTQTVLGLDQPAFEELLQLLLGEHISFSIIEIKDVTKEILAEKLCDYFDRLEIETGKSFAKQIEFYIDSWVSIVGPHIAKTQQVKKCDSTLPAVPRSRLYYELAFKIKGNKQPSITQLIDFSRIMVCLYSAVLNNKDEHIKNFDYSLDGLVPYEIVESLKNEDMYNVIPPRKKRFDTRELYSQDVCTLILSIMILCFIINRKVTGDCDHE